MKRTEWLVIVVFVIFICVGVLYISLRPRNNLDGRLQTVAPEFSSAAQTTAAATPTRRPAPTPTPIPTRNRAPSVVPNAEGAKAERILNEVLSQKQMTDAEAKAYNAAPDYIKEKTYEQARAKERELYDLLWGKDAPPPREWEGDAKRDGMIKEYNMLRGYADAIATGMECVRVRHNRMVTQIESLIDSWNEEMDYLDNLTNEERLALWDYIQEMTAILESRLAFADFANGVLADIQAVLDDPEQDADLLLKTLTILTYHMDDFPYLSVPFYSPEFYQKCLEEYRAGKPLWEINELITPVYFRLN